MHHRSPILDPRSSIFDLQSSLRGLRRAFTLVELMISLAMVVILMVGIHQIFKMTSDTIGMGQQLGSFSRDNRSVQGIFHDDYQRLMKDAPLFIIRSGVAGAGPTWGAFTTEAERSADRDGNPITQDLDGNGQEGQATVNGEITPLSIYNNRNHRVDILGFPAHGLFHRHTANDGSYSSSLTSQDAFIFYEHVRLPTNGNYIDPGDPAVGNVNNSLAGQWILGRIALLMRDPPRDPPAAGDDNFIRRNFAALPLSPLHYKSVATDPAGHLLTDSRYDYIGASLETLRQDVAAIRTFVGPANSDYSTSIWWQPLVYKQNPGPPPINNPATRFECNPRISKPITSESIAKAMPVLLNNCSQFAVEYAGDFLTQDNRQFIHPTGSPAGTLILNPYWGQVTGLEPDGVVDYVVDFSNAGPTPVAGTVSSKVRWYGLPRDTNGDRVIPGAGWKGGAVLSNDLVDVVPLRDVMLTWRNRTDTGVTALNITNPANFLGATFEREFPPPPAGGDYVSGMMTPTPNGDAFRYTCVWVNSSPTMLRLMVKLEDPAGRLPEGQWSEYVVGAP